MASSFVQNCFGNRKVLPSGHTALRDETIVGYENACLNKRRLQNCRFERLEAHQTCIYSKEINMLMPKVQKITLLRVIPTMTFQNSQVRFYVSLIGSGEGTTDPLTHTTHLLKCVLSLSTSQTGWTQSSDVLSDISFDIISDILSDVSFDILTYLLTFFPTYLLAFFLTYLLTLFLTDLLTFFLTHLLTFFLTYLLTLFLTHFAVEVRRATLNSHDRG